MRRLILSTIAFAGLLPLMGSDLAASELRDPPQGRMTIEQLRDLRKQAARRRRRVIFNNDGCDCLYFHEKEQVTVENFLAKRTSALAGTHVDAIAYCTISSGFGNFTHRTRAGSILTRSGTESGLLPGMRNIARDLMDQGTDCLQAVLEFAHRHQLELFWSMRMNDTHDAAHTPAKPYFLFPKLKEDHPEWLVGSHLQRTPYGRWSSVDYARPEIRDLAFRYVEEVCRGYDVDGVELDFFRHLCFFRSVAYGGKASREEQALMTGLLRRLREMTEKVGLERGRPILVAVRVPDSAGYSRDMGLDVEQWLAEGLVDLLVTTCYFQLNPWEYSVAWGHKYGVPVYPCLSDPRVKGETRFQRSSVECYRGRALNAWGAGADGIHLFNLFDVAGTHAPVFREAGDPQLLRTLDRLYFVTVRDGNPESWLAGGTQYRTLPLLTPSRPARIGRGRPLSVEILVGEDLASVAGEREAPQVTCHLAMPQLTDSKSLRVTLNGRELAEGTLANGWVDYAVHVAAMRRGANRLLISLDAPQLQPCHDVVLRVACPRKQKLSRPAGSNAQ